MSTPPPCRQQKVLRVDTKVSEHQEWEAQGRLVVMFYNCGHTLQQDKQSDNTLAKLGFLEPGKSLRDKGTMLSYVMGTRSSQSLTTMKKQLVCWNLSSNKCLLCLKIVCHCNYLFSFVFISDYPINPYLLCGSENWNYGKLSYCECSSLRVPFQPGCLPSPSHC